MVGINFLKKIMKRNFWSILLLIICFNCKSAVSQTFGVAPKLGYYYNYYTQSGDFDLFTLSGTYGIYFGLDIIYCPIEKMELALNASRRLESGSIALNISNDRSVYVPLGNINDLGLSFGYKIKIHKVILMPKAWYTFSFLTSPGAQITTSGPQGSGEFKSISLSGNRFESLGAGLILQRKMSDYISISIHAGFDIGTYFDSFSVHLISGEYDNMQQVSTSTFSYQGNTFQSGFRVIFYFPGRAIHNRPID